MSSGHQYFWCWSRSSKRYQYQEQHIGYLQIFVPADLHSFSTATRRRTVGRFLLCKLHLVYQRHLSMACWTTRLFRLDYYLYARQKDDPEPVGDCIKSLLHFHRQHKHLSQPFSKFVLNSQVFDVNKTSSWCFSSLVTARYKLLISRVLLDGKH